MSVELHIFLSASKVPTADAWQEAIARAGFPTVIQRPGDLQTDTGFWPAHYNGQPTGFEFYLEPAVEILETYPHVAKQVGDRAKCATFCWGGDFLEMYAALCAAAALTKLTDGIYFDPQDDTVYGSDEVVQTTQSVLSSVSI